jgi:hypothetical protein
MDQVKGCFFCLCAAGSRELLGQPRIESKACPALKLPFAHGVLAGAGGPLAQCGMIAQAIILHTPDRNIEFMHPGHAARPPFATWR